MEFVHFTRQIDYAEVDGQRIVTAVFPLDRTAAAAAWIARETGLAIDITHDHRRREPKSWARAVQPAARFVGRKLIPHPLKVAIYPYWMNSRAFADASLRYDTIDLGPDIESFIAKYYAADRALHAEASAAASFRSNCESPISV
jgi:hypothetical protein